MITSMLHKVKRTRGPLFSKGSYELWLILERENKPIEWLKNELQIKGRNVVNRYLYGTRRPSLEIGIRIAERFGIASSLFFIIPKKGSAADRFVLPGEREKQATPASARRARRARTARRKRKAAKK